MATLLFMVQSGHERCGFWFCISISELNTMFLVKTDTVMLNIKCILPYSFLQFLFVAVAG